MSIKTADMQILKLLCQPKCCFSREEMLVYIGKIAPGCQDGKAVAALLYVYMYYKLFNNCMTQNFYLLLMITHSTCIERTVQIFMHPYFVK